MSLLLKAFSDGVGRVFNMPRLSLPLITTLGLTLGAVLCLVTISSALLFQPIPGIKDMQGLRQLKFNLHLNEQVSYSNMSMRRLANLQQHFSDVGEWAGLSSLNRQTTINDTEYAATLYRASDNILNVLGTQLIMGDDVKGNDTKDRVWISRTLWQQAYLGRDDILGQSLTIQDKTYQVAGVIEELYAVESQNTVLPQQIWKITNIAELIGQTEPNSAPSDLDNLFLRLQGEETSIPDEAAFESWLKQFVSEFAEQPEGLNGFYTASRLSLTVSDFRSFVLGSSKALVIGLFVGVLCLLLIAVLNLLNLFIAFYQQRTREFALRISLGASLNKVRSIVFIENLPTFILAGSLGLLIAGWLIRSLPALAEGELPMLSLISIQNITFIAAMVMVLLLNLLFSLFALVDINKQAIMENLGASGKGSFAQQNLWVKQMLMTLQLTLACIVLTAAAMVAKFNHTLVYTDLGYDMDNAYQIAIEYKDKQWQQAMREAKVEPDNEYHQLLKSLKALVEQTEPEAKVVVTGSGPLSSELSVHAFSSESTNGQVVAMYQPRNFSPDYFDIFDIEILAGSSLTQSVHDNHERKVLIDTRMAEAVFPGQAYADVVGKTIPIANPPYIISGIVEKTYSGGGAGLAYDVPMVYLTFFTVGNTLYLTVKMPPGKTISKDRVSAAILAMEPRLKSVSVDSYHSMWQEQTLRQRINLWIVLTLTGLTLFLAAIGVAGMTRMTTNHKKYELAIRMATGAKQSALVRFILKDAMLMLTIGLGCGFILSSFGYTHLKNSLDVLPQFDWAVMAATDIGLIVVVLLSVMIPAWRVIQDEPMAVLKEE